MSLGWAAVVVTNQNNQPRMKSRIHVAGISAALATTAALQAEVKINDNLSLDGYVIGAGVVTEGTAAKNGPEFGKNGFTHDAAYVAVNGSYKSFSSKVSLFSFNPFDGAQSTDNAGVLDAYVTYKIDALAITAGKYLGWLGYESFHSPNNAFISFSQATYRSPFSTGVKADYAGDGFSTGFSVRDSQILADGNFFEGDGEISDDIGYEAYVMLTSVKDLTVFFGAGYEDVDGASKAYTADLWANYVLTEKFSLAGEISAVEDVTDFSWLVQGTYKLTDPLAVSARVTGFEDETTAGADALGYGLASTYTITPNFYVKGEVTKTDYEAGSDVFSYALQGIFKF